MEGNIWLKKVPLKVLVFQWYVLRNRLPTRDNLIRCGVLQPDSHLCVSGCGMEEIIDLLFFFCCNHFESLWILDLYFFLLTRLVY